MQCEVGDVVKARAVAPKETLACAVRPAAAYIHDAQLYNRATGNTQISLGEWREMAVRKGVASSADDCGPLATGSSYGIRQIDADLAQVFPINGSASVWAPLGALEAAPNSKQKAIQAPTRRPIHAKLEPMHLGAECSVRAAYFTHMIMSHDLGKPKSDIAAEMGAAIAAPTVAPDGLPPNRAAMTRWANTVLDRVFQSDRNGPGISYVDLQVDFQHNCARNPENYVADTLINWVRVRRAELLLPELPGG